MSAIFKEPPTMLIATAGRMKALRNASSESPVPKACAMTSSLETVANFVKIEKLPTVTAAPKIRRLDEILVQVDQRRRKLADAKLVALVCATSFTAVCDEAFFSTNKARPA